MPRAPTNPPPRRGGLWAGLRAGARGVWRGLVTELGAKPPRVIRRMHLQAAWIVSVPALIWLTYTVICVRLRIPPSVTWSYITLAGFVATIIIQLALLLKMRRMRAHAERVNYRICPECGYSLADLASEGTCPECGTPYTPDELETLWKRR